MYLKCAWYVVDVLSTLDLHLPQSLNRVVTIKTRYVVVVLSVMDLHLHQALNRVVTEKNKVRICGFVCIGSPPSSITNQSGYDKTMYVVDVLSTLDLHLLQALNRVVTIKTRYVVVVSSVMDLHLPQSLSRVGTIKRVA